MRLQPLRYLMLPRTENSHQISHTGVILNDFSREGSSVCCTIGVSSCRSAAR